MYANKFFNNDEGVSPIVATLVLIVVAIIGAAAVGLIMGSFSSNVSNQASAGNTGAASSTVINVAGSTTIQPVANILAQWFASNNTGVTVNVVGGGSGAGIAAVETGAAQVGMMSENPANSFSTDVSQYNLKVYQIGESGVVFITNANSAHTSITKAQLQNAYTGVAATFNDGTHITKVYSRSDVSGTAYTAMAYLSTTQSAVNTLTPTTGVLPTQVSGNGGVAGAVVADGSTGVDIAYVDSEYYHANSAKVTGVSIVDGTNTWTPSWSNIQSEIMNYQAGGSDPLQYSASLVRPLVLVTKGCPSSMVKAFITYCQSPVHQATFTGNWQVHISQVGSNFRLAPPNC